MSTWHRCPAPDPACGDATLRDLYRVRAAIVVVATQGLPSLVLGVLAGDWIAGWLIDLMRGPLDSALYAVPPDDRRVFWIGALVLAITMLPVTCVAGWRAGHNMDLARR